MYNKHYARGYLLMAVKCAQFIRPEAVRIDSSAQSGINPNHFYSVSSKSRRDLGNLYDSADSELKYQNSLHWWNPAHWSKMWAAKSDEDREKSLEAGRQQIAGQIAKSIPVDYYTARVLSRFGGTKFMNVMPGDNSSLKSTQNSIAGGLNDKDLLYNLMISPHPVKTV